MAGITEIPGKAKPFRVYYRESGKRKAKHFATLLDATEWQREHQREPEWQDLAIKPSERLLMARLRAACAAANVDMEVVISDAIQRVQAKPQQEMPLRESLERFLEECTRRNLRPSTIGTYARHVKLFLLKHPGNTSDVTPEMVKDYVLSRYKNDVSRHITRRSLMSWLRWCRSQGWTRVDWSGRIAWHESKEDEKRISVMAPAEIEAILKHATKGTREAMALMAFAGLRPQEVIPSAGKSVLTWEAIDIARRVILIEGRVAKTRRYRELTELPANLWAWLETVPPGERVGNVCKSNATNFYKTKKRVMKRAKVEAWPKDVLRHSFASYGFHILGQAHTMEIMGHTDGSDVFARDYKGVASPATASAWFSVMP